MKIDGSLVHLERLTTVGRIPLRLRTLLKHPEDDSQGGWFMFVPREFISALDIKFNLSPKNEGWTQAGIFSFKEGDTLYDTPKAYLKWEEALREIGLMITITSARKVAMGDKGTRLPGSVHFSVYLPSADKTRIVMMFTQSLSQDEFVRFLIAGPEGDFAFMLDKAREAIFTGGL